MKSPCASADFRRDGGPAGTARIRQTSAELTRINAGTVTAVTGVRSERKSFSGMTLRTARGRMPLDCVVIELQSVEVGRQKSLAVRLADLATCAHVALASVVPSAPSPPCELHCE
jgi:hypothetical protein